LSRAREAIHERVKGVDVDELIKLVMAKTGISEPMARMAVETVLSYLKTKLPAPVAGQIDGLLAGGAGGLDLGSIGGALGGLFDKK
jgi:hypothetical protein